MRSLADDLRRRSDDDLRLLLLARPDLLTPTPADLGAVAARAGTRASAHRALAMLDAPTIAVATALAILPAPVGVSALAQACRSRPAVIRPLLTRLLDLGLAFGSSRAAYPMRVLGELFGSYPAGLGPPLADLLLTSPARVGTIAGALGAGADVAVITEQLRTRTMELLGDAPAGCSDLLATLTGDGGPLGTVQRARRDLDPASIVPVDWLLTRGMLVPVDDERVVVPREVAIAVRGGVLTLPRPPEPVPGRGREFVERIAPGAATEIVRQVGALLNCLDETAAPVLRQGGIGARDLTRIARSLAAPTGTASFVLVVAAGARLIASDEAADPQFRPTELADQWSQLTVGRRWSALVQGWLQAPWSPTLAGSRDERGTLRATLSPGTERDGERRLRQAVLRVLASAPDSRHDRTTLTAQLRYEQPRGPIASAGALVDTVVHEASALGLLAFGSAPGYAAPLPGPHPDEAAALLDALLPAPLSRVLIQADLTAVAPGPLTPAADDLLRLAADVESAGAATVFRFTSESVQRALNLYDADGLLAGLSDVATGALPQPLEYLITDAARRHARLRVGAASAYVRSDDPDALTELLANPRLSGLGWRRLAPTVVATRTDPGRTLELLRSAGVSASAEDLDGELVVETTRRLRAPSPVSLRGGEPPLPDEDRLDDIVAMLRRVDDLRQHPAPPDEHHPLPPDASRRDLAPVDVSTLLTRLRTAAERGRPVWVALSDGDGEPRLHLVQPVSIQAGQTRAVETSSGRMLTLATHRIVGVAAV